MNIHFTEAYSLASIDLNLKDDGARVSPAQYEIIRQVIYRTADFDYYSLLKFSDNALSSGLQALKKNLSVVVDVPEIQVNIVPELQRTFCNPVYCCATTGKQSDKNKTRAAFGLESLAISHSNSIFIIGQDQTVLETFIDLIKKDVINPSLTIATAPLFLEPDVQKYFQTASIPSIYIDGSKGGATVASAIVNSLINLAWRASRV